MLSEVTGSRRSTEAVTGRVGGCASSSKLPAWGLPAEREGSDACQRTLGEDSRTPRSANESEPAHRVSSRQRSVSKVLLDIEEVAFPQKNAHPFNFPSTAAPALIATVRTVGQNRDDDPVLH
ncbi:hypothetical protein ACVWZV_009302 [Bradyrhizobium sp. GM5.1]